MNPARFPSRKKGKGIGEGIGESGVRGEREEGGRQTVEGKKTGRSAGRTHKEGKQHAQGDDEASRIAAHALHLRAVPPLAPSAQLRLPLPLTLRQHRRCGGQPRRWGRGGRRLG
ncbi:unnamed protein product [Closterium sp. Naga37s-1]|nr:unnamed protein product [Closterium sp. Naga37s-1]